MEDGFAREKTAVDGVRLVERAVGARREVVMNDEGDFEFVRRMNNWRMWRLSERRSLGGSPYPIYNLTPRPPRAENIMPILAGEAEETDAAVGKLERRARRAVEIWYLHSGSANEKRKMLQCRRERMMQLLRQAKAEILAYLALRRGRVA